MKPIEAPKTDHLHSSTDALEWAKGFCEMAKHLGYDDLDADWVHVWFANAMMAMHDHMERKLERLND